ncbi:uncharacterized protein MONOS_16441 [Monocercomonoides exilis]|uniref:uncharacterized protein n=1 Tax=Monocercomonoides exilis TaxID=2049356 RepID=UPI003559E711|nr:hypothetical protein MONOS_16441 [Monocercomonoides exilis]|eukprot:MONOS_16441.1-p1 / transcript=MONOS_16441.1 / gene=MONOS_16441 / organism=Monocercomonoides_exilis_PA203 / gene_product=unspecified product / transcript_product=unspecified product / location=Mono_scaffold01742:2403-2847(+) / protein_length=106 / sequence_SO=supercontig / SO=protein_coding / is_pseudo=false
MLSFPLVVTLPSLIALMGVKSERNLVFAPKVVNAFTTGAGGVEGGAEAADSGAEGATREGETKDGEEELGVQHVAAKDLRQRADIETEEPARGGAAGDGEDQLDA